MSDPKPDHPLVPVSKLEDQSRHVRFGFDTSSDSSDESAEEKPRFQGPAIGAVETDRLVPEEPTIVERQASGETDVVDLDSDDSEEADNEEETSMTQEEYEELT